MNNDFSPSTRRKLSDIVGNADTLKRAWDSTEAAGDFAPLPAGTYSTRIKSGELRTARTGTPEYCLTFEVIESPHATRRIWHSLYLTPAAMPMTKRDLAKLGVTSLTQLDNPLPAGILASVRIVINTGDDGVERNKVKSFTVTGVESPDPFSPDDDDTLGGAASPAPAPAAPMFNPDDDAPPSALIGGK
jgi:hypothetical protein